MKNIDFEILVMFLSCFLGLFFGIFIGFLTIHDEKVNEKILYYECRNENINLEWCWRNFKLN